MNERIQELIDRCTTHYNGGLGTEIEVFDKEKFAQLIVKECVRVAMRSVDDAEPKEAWYLIEEHFGIEQ